MIRFLYRKLYYGFLVMAGIVLVVFFLFNLLPGDPARMMLGQRADVASIEKINKELGRDQPVWMQLLLYVNDLSPISFHSTEPAAATYLEPGKYNVAGALNLGYSQLVIKSPYLRRSYQTGRDVSDVIADALPGTAILALASLMIAAIIGIALGIAAALHRNTWVDYIASFVSIIGMSVPSFFAGIIIAWLFGYVWSDFTGLNMTGSLYSVDPFDGILFTPANLILPALTLGIRPMSVIFQLTRSSMGDVLSQDYIRTAKAKGLSRMVIITGHALKNALNPVITAVSGWFGSLLAGAVFIEYIFGWKGIGKVTVDSLEQYDFPVVMGAVLVVSLCFVIINILVDLLYGLLDPRVRLNG